MKTRHGTLTGGAVHPVTADADVGAMAVLNLDRTGLVIYVRGDGTDPVVEGDDSFAVPSGSRRVLPIDTDGLSEVRLICSGAAKYEVEW